MTNPPVIHWFRRDLRLRDNLALQVAIQTGQPVIPLFIFDPAILSSERIGTPRLKFMLAALASLDTDLRQMGRALLVRHGEPLLALRDVVKQTGAQALFFNADYTPYARMRDDAIRDALGIAVESHHDRLLAVPGEIERDKGQPFVVYSPFKRRWRERIQPAPLADYALDASHFFPLDNLRNDGVPLLTDLGHADTIDVPAASEHEAQRVLQHFVDQRLHVYKQERDRIGNAQDEPQTRTSFLSPYIRFGMLSPRQIMQTAWISQEPESKDEQRSVDHFVDEMIWHEFYTHILWYFPHVTTRNFNSKYDSVPWRDAPDDLQAWKDGLTGYPIVDAAMRQLTGSGWMHNRARMIVASFLTKDLLIDWREGEKFFMQWLIDGDLAANNGGWQWAAGTGTDAQPYFRIFNPILQSKKFDPDGSFIRHWLPQLRDVPDRYIHEPWTMPQPPADYPPPIVDHAQAREAALAAYGETD